MIARRLMPSLLIALLISALFTFWLSRRMTKANPAPTVPSRKLVAVSKNMEAGEHLQISSLQMVDWPVAQPPHGAFLKPEDVAGRMLLYPLPAGELVLDQHLAAPGTGTGLMGKIPEGMRAISVRSDDVAGVAGFLMPGSFVDVLVTYSAGTVAGPITSTVLQNASVLASGQKIEPDPDGKANATDVVTLLVSPRDAQRVTLATSLGKIRFILRNGSDRKNVSGLRPELSLSEEAAAEPRVATPVRAPQKNTQPSTARYTVQTIAGSKQTEETFEGNNNR